jgi:hypothetical protein
MWSYEAKQFRFLRLHDGVQTDEEILGVDDNEHIVGDIANYEI